MEQAVCRYTLRLKGGENDFTNHLNGCKINGSKDRTLQIIFLEIALNREQYNARMMKHKGHLKLEIMSHLGAKSDADIPDVDASFSYDLCVVEEEGEQLQGIGPNGNSASNTMILICVPKNAYLVHQKFLKDKIFTDKTRPQIINEVLDGVKHEIQSKIFKPGEMIDQICIPPSRQLAALQYVDFYLDLFEGALPSYINYSIDGTLYIGSCIENSMKPLKLYYASGDNTLGDDAMTSAKKKPQYDYLVQHAIQESKNYNSICSALGKNQTYTYYPMNKLFSRIKMDINQFNDRMTLRNGFGDDTNVGKHVQETTKKETWFKNHNGLPIVADSKDNLMFTENYVSNYVNQAVSLYIHLDGAIKFKDFLQIGRRIHLTSDFNAIKYNGDYYLDEFEMTFSSHGPFWTGIIDIVAKSSIKLSNT